MFKHETWFGNIANHLKLTRLSVAIAVSYEKRLLCFDEQTLETVSYRLPPPPLAQIIHFLRRYGTLVKTQEHTGFTVFV